MRIYTIHLPPPYTARAAEPVVIREGFSLWAFLFTGLWALFHRMWLIGVAVVVATVALALALAVFSVSDPAQLVVTLALDVWIGSVANDWRRFHLARKGWKEAAVIAAPDRDTALRRYLDLAAIERPPARLVPAAPPSAVPPGTATA